MPFLPNEKSYGNYRKKRRLTLSPRAGKESKTPQPRGINATLHGMQNRVIQVTGGSREP